MTEPATTHTGASRQIGPWGTAARAVVGAGLLAVAALLGIEVLDVVIGLIVMPVVVIGALALRGHGAEPLRLNGAAGHAANIVLGVILLSTITGPAVLFYGVSMLLAAWRGIGACEIFAISNVIRRRDVQLGCPVFLPVDLAEARITGRELYCS